MNPLSIGGVLVNNNLVPRRRYCVSGGELPLMAVRGNFSIVPNTRAFSQEITSTDHPTLNATKRPWVAGAVGVSGALWQCS